MVLKQQAETIGSLRRALKEASRQKSALIDNQMTLEKELKKERDINMGKVIVEEEEAEDNHLNIFAQLVEEYTVKGERYTDPDFPPNQFSLIEDWHDKENKDIREVIEEWKGINWIRATQIPEFSTRDQYDKLEVFKGKIEAADIIQGRLNDGYLLSALGAMTEKERVIEQIFVNSDLNKAGIFSIISYKHGEKQQVIIDDYFPCRN